MVDRQQGLVFSQEAAVTAHLSRLAGDDHLLQRDLDFDPTADKAGIGRIVVALHPQVMVTGKTGGKPQRRVGQHRREGHHRSPIFEDRLRRPLPGGAVDPLVGPSEPSRQLTVEIGDILKGTSRQEAGLQIAVGPFNHPFGFGVVRTNQHRSHPQAAAEGLELGGQLLTSSPDPADAALLIPHRLAGHRSELGDDRQHPRQHVVGSAGRDHQPTDQPGESGDSHHRPQLGRLSEPDRDQNIGLPKVELGQLPGLIARPLRRVGRSIERTQLRHPIPQHRNPPIPADPFGDHRGRHLREVGEQLTDLGFERIDDRAPRPPHIARRHIGTQRLPHRVTRHPQPFGDSPRSQLLGPMQPTDLSPILHLDQSPILLAVRGQDRTPDAVSGGPGRQKGQNSTGDKGPVLGRWRQPPTGRS